MILSSIVANMANFRGFVAVTDLLRLFKTENSKKIVGLVALSVWNMNYYYMRRKNDYEIVMLVLGRSRHQFKNWIIFYGFLKFSALSRRKNCSVLLIILQFVPFRSSLKLHIRKIQYIPETVIDSPLHRVVEKNFVICQGNIELETTVGKSVRNILIVI